MRSRRRGDGGRGWWRAGFLLAATLSPTAAAQELRVDRLSTVDGLSHSSVWAITQDRQGFLWFATQEGLDRYDGYRFVVYEHDPEDPESLSENDLLSLREDGRGDLWIGTRGTGVNRFLKAEERFERFRHDPEDPGSLSHDLVWSILEDRHGELWIGTENGLNRFRPATRDFVRYLHRDDQGSLRSKALFEDSRGVLWVATNDGLARFERDTGTFVHFRHDPENPDSLGSDSLTALAEDANGDLWIGSDRGLDRLPPGSESFEHHRHDPDDPGSLSGDRIFTVHVDRRGELWAGTFTSGLNRLDRTTGRFIRYRSHPGDARSLGSDTILTIFEDRSGLLWFGTYKGVHKFDRIHEQFTTYRHRPDDDATLSSDLVRAIYQDRAGEVWVGTGRGLDLLDPERHRVERFQASSGAVGLLEEQAIGVVTEDHLGELWVGLWTGGLARIDRSRRRVVHYRHDPSDPSGLIDDQVRTLLEDGSRRLWIGTFHGLCRFDRESRSFLPYPRDGADPASLDKDPIYAMTETRSGDLWIGSMNNGLYRLRAGSERFERFVHDPDDPASLASNRVGSLFEDHRGRLWVGTVGGGLDRFDPVEERFVHTRESDGLASDTVIALVEDTSGHLWISTSRGVSRFDPENRTIESYGVEDGLQGNAFSHRAALRSASGELFFGGLDGLSSFDPSALTRNLYRPPVVITDFRLFNAPVPLRRTAPDSPLERSILASERIELTHRQYVFSFDFAALDYAHPQRNQYVYRLEGFDRYWIRTDATQRSVQYSNLAPGEYTFTVRGSGAAGVWNDDGDSITVVVHPPPWRSGWALTLYALLLAGGTWGVSSFQRRKLQHERQIVRRLREVDKLKDEFLANTSHELRTPLYGITGLVEALLDGARGDLPDRVRGDLSMVVACGQRLSALVNDILDFSKIRHDSLSLDRRPVDLKVVADVVLTLSRPLVGQRMLELGNDVPSGLPAAWADIGRLQQILHNLVGNALKFTDKGRIAVSAEEAEGELVVHVTDTGHGIPEAQQQRIFEVFEQGDPSIEREQGGTGLGLAVTRQLVELHGGRLWVDSTVGRGSTFSFTLPVSDEPAPAGLDSDLSGTLAVESEPSPPATDATEGSPGELAVSILVVDDEAVNRQVLRNQLAAEGYALTLAASGEEALTLCEDQTFDLVLLDIMMPRLSGYEVCRELRERHSLEELPVIFLTAKNQAEDLVVGLAAGANDYLPKPVGKRELLARVKTHLELLRIHRQLTHLVAERSTRLEERERLLHEREQLIGELEERNSELARFNYTVTHDLKNPLVTIKNFLGLLRRDAEAGHGERLGGHLERLDKAADHMQRLLEQLYELSRIGVRTRAPATVSLGELADAALRKLADRFEKRPYEVHLRDTLPSVHGDRERFEELLFHLLENAVEHRGDATKSSLEIGTAERRDTSPRTVTFYVRDDGPGIDPRYHEKIFGLFERLDSTSPSTGIGLTLARRIAEVHGGRLWVESDGPGHGSTFYVSLPRGGP